MFGRKKLQQQLDKLSEKVDFLMNEIGNFKNTIGSLEERIHKLEYPETQPVGTKPKSTGDEEDDLG